MDQASPKFLLASIHDVSPRFEGQVDQLVEELGRVAGRRFAMLVVPNFWGRAPIVPGTAFATRLRQWSDAGIEMILHGFYHRDSAGHRGLDRLRAKHLTASEGEFLGIGREDAAARITSGKKLIEDVIGRPVTGFVAPAWLYGSEALPAIAECGIEFAEDHLRVWSPQTGRTLARGPVITWATRTPFRLESSLVAAAALGRLAPQRVLRIAVHPGDCGSERTMASVRTTLARAVRTRPPASYTELVERSG